MNNTKSIVDLSTKLNKYQRRAATGDANKKGIYERKVAQYKSELAKLGVTQTGGELTSKLAAQQKELDMALESLRQSINTTNGLSDPTSKLTKLTSVNTERTIDNILNDALLESQRLRK